MNLKLDSGIWAEQAKIQASDKQKADEFGHDAAIYQDYVLVGAPFDSASGRVSAGKAFVFKRNSSNWVEEDSLVASDGDVGDNFGRAVDIYGDYAMVGSQNPIGDNRGAVYVFQRNGNDWTQIDKLVPNDLEPGADFGIAISMDGDAAIIGALSGDGNEVGSGAAYVFRRNGSTWQQEAKLIGSDAVVGARNQAVGSSLFQGAAYLFKRNGSSWIEELQIISGDGEESDSFGSAVAIDGDTVIVGAAGDEGGEGAAYIYTGSTITSINDPKEFSLPTEFELEQNYPNPFNPTTKIRFTIPSSAGMAAISVDIFNTKGQRVRSLYKGSVPSGRHELEWNGENDSGLPQASGVYLLELRSSNILKTRKMTLLK